MKNQNPLGIDFGSIIAAAEKRRINLETIGQLVALNVETTFHALAEVDSLLQMLEVRWEALDPEGRAMLPDDVRKVVAASRQFQSNVQGILGYEMVGMKTPGWRDLRKYAAPAEAQAAHKAMLDYAPQAVYKTTLDYEPQENGTDLHTGQYRIEVAFASTSDSRTISEALQEVYTHAEGGISGSFEVKTDGTYCWIYFNRELSDDRQFILNRIAKNMLLSPARAACEQLEAELLETRDDPDHSDLVGSILEGLATAQVDFPGE